MNDYVSDAVTALINNDGYKFKDNIQAALNQKAYDSIDARKAEIATALFNGEDEQVEVQDHEEDSNENFDDLDTEPEE